MDSIKHIILKACHYESNKPRSAPCLLVTTWPSVSNVKPAASLCLEFHAHSPSSQASRLTAFLVKKRKQTCDLLMKRAIGLTRF
eukprot:1162059-Pelagomonas_calceolata.AAC.1